MGIQFDLKLLPIRRDLEGDAAGQEQERGDDGGVGDEALEAERIEQAVLADVEEEQPVEGQVDQNDHLRVP